MDRDAFVAACLALGLNLSPEQAETCESFEDSLYEANQTMNLTRVPKKECWITHFLDSLLHCELIPSGSVLDIGTGPGFPAWPLALVRPDCVVTALDSNAKMLGFLRQHPLPNLEIAQVRIEESNLSESFDTVTGRAVAPYPVQVEISSRPCKKGGLIIPMRTSKDREAIESFPYDELGLELTGIEERELPVVGAIRLFPLIRKVKRTPPGFPRPWALMKKKPLNG